MKTLITFSLAVSLLLPIVSAAEQAIKQGDIEIHYNAMPTDELQPEVAKNYNIVRSRNRGLLTISVLRKNKLGVSAPVPAMLNASAVNLNAQFTQIGMREIRDGGAVYYLGEFRIAPPDTLKFSISVKPSGETRQYPAAFSRTFFK